MHVQAVPLKAGCEPVAQQMEAPGEDTVLAAHGEQVPIPAFAEKKLLEQGIHAAALLAPVTPFVEVPEGQSVQREVPTLLEYEPAAQFEHAVTLPGEKRPALQGTGAPEGVAHLLPAGQGVQAVAPAAVE